MFILKRWNRSLPEDGKGIGLYGEDLAVSHLEKSGYIILERNYRKQYGEIDIIAEDGNVLVFVEVKTRKSSRFGSPFEAVDLRKQQKMSRVAQAYMNSRKTHDRAARFDVVGVLLREKKYPEIKIVRDAFELSCE